MLPFFFFFLRLEMQALWTQDRRQRVSFLYKRKPETGAVQSCKCVSCSSKSPPPLHFILEIVSFCIKTGGTVVPPDRGEEVRHLVVYTEEHVGSSRHHTASFKVNQSRNCCRSTRASAVITISATVLYFLQLVL